MPTRPLLQWKSEYETGVSSIDEQHRRLFGYLGDLHDAVEARDGTAERIAGLDHASLVEALTHFAEVRALDDLRRATDPSGVPTWAAFARGVVAGAMEA